MRTVVREGNGAFSVVMEKEGEEIASKTFELETKGPKQPPYKQMAVTVPVSFRGAIFPYPDLARQTVEEATRGVG